MSKQTKIFFRLKNVSTSSQAMDSIKVDIKTNEDFGTLTYPFVEYLMFPIKPELDEITLKMTFFHNYLKVNETELLLNSKFISKEREKEKLVNFTFGKSNFPFSATIFILVTTDGSKKESNFLSLFKRNSLTKSALSKNIESNYKSVDIQTKTMTQNNSDLVNHFSGEKSESEENDTHREEVKIVSNQLKSEVLRKSLNLNYSDFTFNTSCQRCNYLEQMIKAQNNDIKVLQNQLESFLSGNLDPKYKLTELESQNLLKEPIFDKLFPETVKENNGEKLKGNEIDGKKKSKELLKAYGSETITTSPRKSENERKSPERKRSERSPEKEKINYQRPGKDNVDVYLLEENRERKIQKYEQEIDNLKTQLFAILKQKKALEIIQNENETLKSQIAKSEALRIENESKLLQTNGILQEKINSDLQEIFNLKKENKLWNEKSNKLESDNSKISNENTQLDKKIKELENELIVRVASLDQTKSLKETYNLFKDDSVKEKEKINNQEMFKKSLIEMTAKIDDLKKDNAKITIENASLQSKLKDIENTLFQKNKENTEKQKKISDLESTLTVLKSEQLLLNDVIKHRDELTVKFNRIMEINYNLNEDICKVNNSFTEQSLINQEIVNSLNNEKKEISAKLEESQKSINHFESLILNLQNEIEKKNRELETLSNNQLFKKNSEEQNKILQDMIKSIFEYNGKIITEINEFGDYMIKQSDKTSMAQHYIRKLMRAYFEKEKELKEQRKFVDVEKKNEIIYYPLKEDNLDVKLADLINSYPSKSRIKYTFVRESRGNYKYGKRKVIVSLENGRIYLKTSIYVLNFDDFIDKYGCEEFTDSSNSLEKKNKNRSCSPLK